MTRGPNLDRSDLKKKLLGASRKLVKRDGFTAFNIRSLATSSGCAIGSIYNVFENLDDIALHVNAQTLESIYRRMELISKKKSPPLERVRQFGICYINYGLKNYHLWNMLFEHRLPKGVVLPGWYQKIIDQIFDLIAANVELFLDGNREKAGRAAIVLWTGLHGISALALSGSLNSVKTESATILADSLIINYLEGLRASLPGGAAE